MQLRKLKAFNFKTFESFNNGNDLKTKTDTLDVETVQKDVYIITSKKYTSDQRLWRPTDK